MARETSIEAFNTIRENKMLGNLQWQVYKVIFRHGPMSIRQIAKHFPHRNDRSISPRLSELRSIGVVKEGEDSKDPETGHRVIMWEVTDSLPTKPVKKAPARCRKCQVAAQRDRLIEQVKELQRTVNALQSADKATEQQSLWP